MRSGKIRSRDYAARFDRSAREMSWHPEVLFGLVWEFVQPGDILLDLGIGTGLASIPFHKAGVKIYGLDASEEMLQVCRSKNFAVELELFDLTNQPLPYPDEFFHHVISTGVFHEFGDLSSLFSETSRLLKKRGTFGFTIDELEPDDMMEYTPLHQGNFASKPDEEFGTYRYKHRRIYILELLKNNGFVALKEFKFLLSRDPETRREHYEKAYIAGKERF